MQVRGEISEESRIELLKVLDKEGKLVIKSSIIKVLQQLVEREEKAMQEIDGDGNMQWEKGGEDAKQDTITTLQAIKKLL